MDGGRERSLVESLKVWAFMTHVTATCFLIWTRQDSVRASVPVHRLQSASHYRAADESYLALLGVALLLHCLRFLLALVSFSPLSLYLCLELLLDVCGGFMVVWIIIDGLEWTAYASVFVLCVALPALLASSRFALRIVRRMRLFKEPNPSDPLLKRIYYRCFPPPAQVAPR